MEAGVDHPLVLNFGHPLNLICRQQLDRELPGWREWRRSGPYRVADAAEPETEIHHWLRELESEVPGWSQRSDLYYIAHSFSPVNTALLGILRDEHGVSPLEISRDRAPDSPVEIFIVYRVGKRHVDTSLARTEPIPGFLVDLSTQPLSQEQQDQVNLLMPPWLRLQYIYTPMPEAAADLEAAEIDRLIVGMAQRHHIMPEEHPCVLAWFRHGGYPNDVVRFMARFHGVTGYFPSMVKFGLKRAWVGTTNVNVLASLSNWEVVDVESYGRLRAEGNALRAGFVPRPGLPPQPEDGNNGVLPSAVALVALQWPRWARNHTQDQARWPTLLTRLDGTLEPGHVTPARAGVDEDIIHALKSLQRPAEWASEGPDPGVFFDAIRQYVANVGRRYHDAITSLDQVRSRLEGRLEEWKHWHPWHFRIEVTDADPPTRRVAVNLDVLVQGVVLPLLQNASAEGARAVGITSRVVGQGDDEAWLLEVMNDGLPFDELGHLDQEGHVHGGISSILAFARAHLATLRVHSQAGEGQWKTREWHGGSWRWNETRNGLIPAGTAPHGWGAVGLLPHRSHPPQPWRVCWEVALPLAVLGE